MSLPYLPNPTPATLTSPHELDTLTADFGKGPVVGIGIAYRVPDKSPSVRAAEADFFAELFDQLRKELPFTQWEH